MNQSDKPEYYAHPTALVDEPVTVGAGTKIWHFCHVRSGAVVGRDCVLGQNVYVDDKVTLGDNVHVQNNVSIYEGVILEDNVFCGPSMVFTNVVNPRSHVPRKDEFRQTLVRRGASIGANATIVCGHHVGRYAFVGAGSVVTRDVPDFALVFGNPARQQGWMCQCGIRLTLDGDHGRCEVCGDRYALQGEALVRLNEAGEPRSES